MKRRRHRPMLMSMKIKVSAERRIDAPASRVYTYIADFREHHPRFLPPQFSDLVVEAGGYGAGTVHRFTLTMGGRTSTARVRVDEPEPGRVLTETETTRQMVTTFTVDPEPRSMSRVRIESEWEAHGIRALVERLLVPPMLRRLYRSELQLLDAYARKTPMVETQKGRVARGFVVS